MIKLNNYYIFLSFSEFKVPCFFCTVKYTTNTFFLQGYLVANHLPREDLEDIYLYLNTHCLLSLSHDQHMGQLVVWREVFPWRRCHSHSTPLLPGYTEMEARWFLLVVGMVSRNFLFSKRTVKFWNS